MLYKTSVFFIRIFSTNDLKHKRRITLRNSARTDLTSSQDLSWNNYANVLSVARNPTIRRLAVSVRSRGFSLLNLNQLDGTSVRVFEFASIPVLVLIRRIDPAKLTKKKFTFSKKYLSSNRALRNVAIAACKLQFTIKFRVKRFCKSLKH